jgi:hypothetical protein
MKPSQQTAISEPCLLGCETILAQFRHNGPSMSTLILTVNAGYE